MNFECSSAFIINYPVSMYEEIIYMPTVGSNLLTSKTEKKGTFLSTW